LKREFLLLEGVESDNKIHWIQERIDQMNKYRNLQNCLDGASVIMDVVEEFELEGNFKAIEQILKLVRFYIIQLLLKYLLGLIYAIEYCFVFVFVFREWISQNNIAWNAKREMR
jgi:hypothetical protein